MPTSTPKLPRPGPGRLRERRRLVLHAVVHAAALVTLLTALRSGVDVGADLIVLGLAAVLASAFPLPLPGREHDKTSLVPVALIGGALVLPWPTVVWLMGVAVLLGRLADRQQLRGAFYNTSAAVLEAVTACAAIGLVHAVAPTVDPLLVLAASAVAATVAIGLANIVLMAPVFALSGTPLRTAADAIVRADSVPLAVLGATAISVAVLHGQHPLLVVTLFAPLVVVSLYERTVDRALREAVRATTDPLTGYGNRRAFEERCTRELERLALGAVASVGVVLLDLDGFKGVNDRHGHERGDELLVEVARALGSDGYRLGGDEFALVLTGLDQQRAAQRGAEAAARIAAGQLAAAHGVTASSGVAIELEAAGTDAAAIADLVGRADGALYAAKRARTAAA